MRVREVTQAERDALRRVIYDVPAVGDIASLAMNIQAVMATDISWHLRIRLLDAMRAMRDDYPDMIVRRPTAEDISMPVHANTYARVAAMPGVPAFRSDRFRALAAKAIEQGWTVTKTSGGHARIERGGFAFIVSTTSNGQGRAWKNARALARRMGVDVDGL
jgi:hypothetical protein